MTTKLKLAAAALAAVLLLGGGWAAYRHFGGHHHGEAQQEVYYCPMHPDYTSDKPGDCPICGMHLVKREHPAAAPAGERKVKFYRNPMDPSVTSKVPMKDEMGMDYVPVYEDGTRAAAVAGRGPVTISPEKQQLIGLRTGKAAWRAIPITVRASGTVAYDPDLYRAITEYKEALAAYGRIKEGGWPEAAERAKAVVDSSKMKLRQLGFGDEHLEGAEKDPEHYGNLLLPEDEVWVYAQVYEYESASVKPGQKAVVTSSAYPGKEFAGIVRSLDPIFSADTRTLRARIETQNPGRELRLEMYVEAAIKAAPAPVLAVPAGAILNTGEKEIVFVMKGEGTFEPREIKSGRRNDEYAEVLSGLRAGETVVTSANFIVDSESRMKAAIGD